MGGRFEPRMRWVRPALMHVATLLCGVALGRLLWDAGATPARATVTGATAHGSAMNRPVAEVSAGTVYVASGRVQLGRASGSVLLTVSIDAK